jgi:hypothetical protein
VPEGKALNGSRSKLSLEQLQYVCFDPEGSPDSDGCFPA